MPTHPYPTPDADPWTDITQYIDLLIAAVDYELDRPDVWPDGEAAEGQGYMEDLKAWLQELSNTMFTPIGGIMAFFGTTAPDGWLFCDGTEYNQADYPALVAALPDAYKNNATGKFNTPDFLRRMLVGADDAEGGSGEFPLASDGGESTHTLNANEMPSHTHIQTAHNHTQDAHNHTQAAHNHTQDSHNHTQAAHNHTQDAHGHTISSHGHDVNVVAPTTALGAGGIALASIAANATRSSNGTAPTATNTTATNQSTTAVNNAATATNQATTAVNNAATATNQATTAVNNAATATNQATTAVNQNTGGGQPHNNMPPYIAVNFIIRAR